MTFLKKLFVESCPLCGDTLSASTSNVIHSHIVKTCPKGHYEKELHPALGVQVEHHLR